MFHEIDVDSSIGPRGMDITVVTSATNDDEGRALLRAGLPFRRTEQMAKKALVNKANKKPKFAVRAYTRCNKCGRPHAVYPSSACAESACREMAHAGELPGVQKSSW